MKLGIYTLALPEYTPLEALEFASELGVDGIQWAVWQDNGDKSNPLPDRGNRCVMSTNEICAKAGVLRETASQLGLEMPSISCRGFGDMEWVEEQMRAADAIGADTVRLNAGAYHANQGGFHVQMQKTHERYAEVGRIAKKYGCRALTETESWGTMLGASTYASWAILNGLDPEHVGILWDPASLIIKGNEDYTMDIDAAGEYLGMDHAMNICWQPGEFIDGRRQWHWDWCSMREGQVDWPAVIAALKTSGYNGWIMIEDFSAIQSFGGSLRTIKSVLDAPAMDRLSDTVSWLRELMG